SFLDGRDAHPTITIKIVSYLIRDPKMVLFDGSIARSGRTQNWSKLILDLCSGTGRAIVPSS
ncbi:hypothetical protein QUB17_26915, partial [Microcoleus sp. B5-C4]